MNKLPAALLLLALLAPAARADDRTAVARYQEAMKLWRANSPDTDRIEELLKGALSEARRKDLKLNFLLILGQFYQGKTGEFEKALKQYDRLIGMTIGARKTNTKNLKAQALLNKGTITYMQSGGDTQKALHLFVAAHETYQTALTADVLSQMMFRLGRDPKSKAGGRTKAMEKSLKLAREAVARGESNRSKRNTPARRAKYRLQLVIVLQALGKVDEAKTNWDATDQAALKKNPNAHFQRAVLLALQGKPAGEVAAVLRMGLSKKLRPGVLARNQYRFNLRAEPDLRRFVERADWKDLVTDEKVRKKKKKRARPASRPSR